MSQGMRTIIFPVKDLARAKALYGKLLGVEPYTDGPHYVGFRVGEQEIGLDPNGHNSGISGPICYWHVADIKQSVRMLLDLGAHVQQEVQDVGRGTLIATVSDADDNVFGLIQSP